MIDIAQWIDKRGHVIREESFPPYAGIGRASFIRNGLNKGYKVTYDGKEVYWSTDNSIFSEGEWRYK